MSTRKKLACLLNFSITLLVLSGVTLSTYSQNIPFSIKEQFLSKNKQNLQDSINKQTEIELPFILGRQHTWIANKVNHPYFNTNEWVKGSLVFKDKLYSAEGLKYDIENDKLIHLRYTDDFKMNIIALDQNFISEFQMHNATFRYFRGLKNRRGNALKDGYYEVVYNGKLMFLSRLEKSKSIEDNSVYMTYKLSTELFLVKDGILIEVKSMAKLINQLKDKKKELKKYVRDNYLKLNLSDYSSAADVLKFYESL